MGYNLPDTPLAHCTLVIEVSVLEQFGYWHDRCIDHACVATRPSCLPVLGTGAVESSHLLPVLLAGMC